MATGCDIIYTILVDRADQDDRMFVHAQLMGHVEDVKMSAYRDDLDGMLGAPMGQEAVEMQNLIRYVTGD